mgnify:CR=1 FL=1
MYNDLNVLSTYILYVHSSQFMDAPIRTFWHAVTGAVRSTTFLSAFVGIFQVACLPHINFVV